VFRKPTIPSPRNLVLALAAVALAVAALAIWDGSSSSESEASSFIVKSSDPVTSRKSTPSVPKFSWPSPNSRSTGGQEASEPSVEEGAIEPCSLVSEDEAASILEGNVNVTEGLQGPTCIYSKHGSNLQVAVGVTETTPLPNLRRRPDKASRVQVGDHTGWCLRYGSSSLEVPLGDGRVLDVTAPCATATRFAALALERVPS
jgi:hypothetical protein